MDTPQVVLHGGPLDGTTHLAPSKARHIDVTMADRTLHRYERTSATDATGRPVFHWAGRV
ncbi:hypothetical protein [Kutzneria sp. NPDC052558]|uniref:hypothetical protein n=1 Tax=Kutzneria sp. NPDC052558 TaxID=3364121 RepID=UPI0037C62768